MRLFDYQLVSSLKARLYWACHTARVGFIYDLISGRDTDYWWLSYPDIEVHFKYNYFLNKFVLKSISNGIDSILLINKEDVVSLINWS